jgi:hypothetical protein
MAQTTFSGPLQTGDRPAGFPGGPNIGRVVLSQTFLINWAPTILINNGSVNLPFNSQIVAIYADVLTQYDSLTSATLTVGTASAGTQYANGVNVKTGVRVIPTFTAAQLAAMANTGSNGVVVGTVTSVGQPTTGQVRVTIEYVQTQSSTD